MEKYDEEHELWLLILLRWIGVSTLVGLIILSLYLADFLNNNPPQNNSITQTQTNKYSSTIKHPNMVALEDIKFPENFFFGTAYSDFQTAGLAPASDWAAEWDKIAEITQKEAGRPAVHSGIANDFLNRYEEDFDLAEEIGIQVHRISLEWARFEPEEGRWDMDMVKKYRQIFLYMKSKNIEPMICLNHFPNPKWFTDMGGWENPQSKYYYARYAEFLANNFGLPLKIKWWLTFNEPQFTISIPYSKGSWPPFKEITGPQDTEGTQRLLSVASNVLDGHRLAYRAIHRVMGRNPKPMVGLASAVGAFYPNDPNSALDKIAYNTFNAINTLLLDYTLGITDRDFIGLNYYGRTTLKLHISIRTILPWLSAERPFAIEWDPYNRAQGERPKEFYPQGLYETIMKFKNLGLPIIITENGLSDPEDRFREEFLVLHLKAIHNAIRDGADVIGYQYWSLADTWEPGDLSFSHFGLISINRESNLERKLRPSAFTYRDIIKTKTVPKELFEKHKELLP